MISQKHIINEVEYIVRAKNKASLDKAVEFLYQCNEYEMAQLEEELNIDFDKLLVERLGDPTEEVKEEPAIETPVEEAKPKPVRKKGPNYIKKDSKTVNLGGMGKSE